MDLTPDPLTAQEKKLVSFALEVGKTAEADWPAALVEIGNARKKELRDFRKRWDAMTADSRDALLWMLARRTGIEDRSALDVGAAADDFLAMTRGRRGPDIPGLRTVAGTLREIWIARGGDGALKNFWRDKQPRYDARREHSARASEAEGPSDMIKFIAKHLIEVFGVEAICPSSDAAKLRPENIFAAACTKADTALRSA